jgi:glutaredoxin
MELVFFVKRDCEACKNAKEKVSFFLDKWGAADSVQTRAIDLDSEDGLVEAAMSGVSDVPTIILRNEGDEVARWGRKAPQSEELRSALGL